MLSLADITSYYQLFLAQGLGVGIGIGFLFLPALAIQGHHWKKRRTLAMGIVLTGVLVLQLSCFKRLQPPRFGVWWSGIPNYDEPAIPSYYYWLCLVCEDHGFCGYWTTCHREITHVYEPTTYARSRPKTRHPFHPH